MQKTHDNDSVASTTKWKALPIAVKSSVVVTIATSLLFLFSLNASTKEAIQLILPEAAVCRLQDT
jgi:hypothetical protein